MIYVEYQITIIHTESKAMPHLSGKIKYARQAVASKFTLNIS